MTFKKELALCLLLAASIFSAQLVSLEADRSFASIREATEKDCRQYRNAHPDSSVCADDDYQPGVVKELNPAKASIARAREALDHDQADAAEQHLVSAMDVASRVARRDTLIAKLVAVAIVDEALPILESNKLDPAVVRAILAHAPRSLGDKPLESIRIDRNHGLVAVTDQRWLLSTGLGESLVKRAMTNDDRVFDGMRTAIEKDDLAACEKAGELREHGPFASTFASNWEKWCSKFVQIHSTAARLRALRRQS